MRNKFTRGLWAQEARILDSIQKKITQYQENVSAHYQRNTLLLFIDSREKMLTNMEISIQAEKPSSFFHFRTIKLQQTIQDLRIQLSDFKQKILHAENSANDLVNQYKRKIHNLVTSYTNMNAFEYLNSAKAGSNKFKRTLGYKVWYKTRIKLDYFRQIQNLKTRQHNSLAQLLLTEDQTFIENISADKIPMEGEIGLLIIQRLQEIFYNSTTPIHLKKIAIKKIKETMASDTADNLLFYNEAMLHQEITKLFLHAELHPENKFAWLGTARAVDATIQYVRPLCIYFNPPRHYLTWGMNRLWLHAAISLGYQFHLVEQHFPTIEKAILSQDPSKYLEQLLLETRGDSLAYTSQYNGHHTCTATNHEVLALMDLGCTAYKDKYDNSIKFAPQKKAYEDPLSLYASKLSMMGAFRRPPIGRIHSTSDIHASNPPPYDEWTNHFVWNR